MLKGLLIGVYLLLVGQAGLATEIKGLTLYVEEMRLAYPEDVLPLNETIEFRMSEFGLKATQPVYHLARDKSYELFFISINGRWYFRLWPVGYRVRKNRLYAAVTGKNTVGCIPIVKWAPLMEGEQTIYQMKMGSSKARIKFIFK